MSDDENVRGVARLVGVFIKVDFGALVRCRQSGVFRPCYPKAGSEVCLAVVGIERSPFHGDSIDGCNRVLILRHTVRTGRDRGSGKLLAILGRAPRLPRTAVTFVGVEPEIYIRGNRL